MRRVGSTGWVGWVFLLVKATCRLSAPCYHYPLISPPHREEVQKAKKPTQLQLCGSRRVKLTAKLSWAELMLWYHMPLCLVGQLSTDPVSGMLQDPLEGYSFMTEALCLPVCF